MPSTDIKPWHGRLRGLDAFVVASGPSSGMFAPEAVRRFAQGKVVIGTNDVWRVLNGEPLPCDFYVILDRHFYDTHWRELHAYRSYRPRSLPVTYFDLDVPHLRIPIDMKADAAEELRRDIRRPYDPDSYFHGHSSGIAACQFAMKLGCRCIYMLGHDLTVTGARTHGYGDRAGVREHGYHQGLTMRAGYGLLAQHARELNIRMINLSPVSTLTEFEQHPEILR